MVGYIKRGKLILILIVILLPIVSAIDISISPIKNINENGNLKVNYLINNEIEKGSYFIRYQIIDLNGKIELQQEETIVLENNIDLEKEFSLVSIKPGKYNLVIGLYLYNELVTKEESEFTIVSEPIKEKIARQNKYTLASYSLVIILVLFIILILIKQRNKLKNIEKEQPKKLKQIYEDFQKTKSVVETKLRLEREMSILKRAYRLRCISKDSYYKGKRRIENLIKKIEKLIY